MDLKDKVVVITGGTKGIGLSIVKKLLTKEIKVIALFELETPTTTEAFSELQKQYGERIVMYACDVTNTSLLEGNFDNVFKKYKAIDVLINNAGILNDNAPERMINLNYKATVLGCLMMIERVGEHKGGKGGLIINIASILGLMNNVMPIYCSTKHAVVSFTRTMKAQFDKTGVRVMAICPGMTNTAALEDALRGLDFIDSDGLLEPFVMQSPENVAAACIRVIDEGRSGDIWVSEDDQPAYTVGAFEDYKSLRVNS